MKQILTGADLFNAIMMQKSVDPRLVVLVESPEDCGLIDPHLNEHSVQSYPGYGKESVLEVAALLEANGEKTVVPVVDADLDRVTGRATGHPKNVILTEFYDLDADAFFHCPSITIALSANFGQKELREAHLAKCGLDAIDLTVEMAASVGALRYCSVQRREGIQLRDFPMQTAVDGYESGTLNSNVLAMGVMRSSNAGASISIQDMSTALSSVSDVRPLCSGHDLMAGLAALIRSRWGGKVGRDHLASAFRAGIGCACWTKTVVYRSVRDWAARFGVVAWTCP